MLKEVEQIRKQVRDVSWQVAKMEEAFSQKPAPSPPRKNNSTDKNIHNNH